MFRITSYNVCYTKLLRNEHSISSKEIKEIVDCLKEEMEEYTAKTIKKHFISLAEHILQKMGE